MSDRKLTKLWIQPDQLRQASDSLALVTPVELWTMDNNGTVPVYVELPDRKPGLDIVEAYKRGEVVIESEKGYNEGWNACLDAIERGGE